VTSAKPKNESVAKGDRRSGHDRRSGRDRRQQDILPPGRRDRRQGIEPRKPEVTEVEMTPEEWEALYGGGPRIG
jgi:hypothetical protein